MGVQVFLLPSTDAYLEYVLKHCEDDTISQLTIVKVSICVCVFVYVESMNGMCIIIDNRVKG